MPCVCNHWLLAGLAGLNMKSWLREFIKDQASVEYCPYCMNERENKRSCCGEVHFIAFCDFDKETQHQIAMDKWESQK